MQLFKKKEDKEITREDISPELYRQLEEEWYKTFEFFRLYQPAPENQSPWVQYVIVIVAFVNAILILWRT